MVKRGSTKRSKSTKTATAGGATVGYEAALWEMADALRSGMDAAEYKHVVLGLKATKTVLEQAEVLSEAWVEAA